MIVGVEKVDEDDNNSGEYVVDIHGGQIGECQLWKVVVDGEDAKIENGQDGQVYITEHRGDFSTSLGELVLGPRAQPPHSWPVILQARR